MCPGNERAPRPCSRSNTRQRQTADCARRSYRGPSRAQHPSLCCTAPPGRCKRGLQEMDEYRPKVAALTWDHILLCRMRTHGWRYRTRYRTRDSSPYAILSSLACAAQLIAPPPTQEKRASAPPKLFNNSSFIAIMRSLNPAHSPTATRAPSCDQAKTSPRS